MRVTPSMQNRNFLENIMNTKERLDLAQEQLASGKKVNRLSDNPYAASQLSQIVAASSTNDQYISSNDQLRSRFDIIDATLQMEIRNIDNVKTIVAQALSGTITDEARQTLTVGVEGAKRQALSDANLQSNGIYLFAGTETSTTPFVETAGVVNYQGNDEAIYQRLDRSTVIQTNITGEELYNSDPPIFTVLDDIKTAISANDKTTLHTQMDRLNSISERLNSISTRVGNNSQLVEQIQSRLKAQNVALQTESSRLGDANMVEAISEFNLADQAVNVSLSSQAKIRQLSLIDFLQ